MNDIEILVWTITGLMIFMALVFVRTNALTEFLAFLKNKPAIWFFYQGRKPRLRIPSKVEKHGVLFKNKKKKVMEYYPLNQRCVYDEGPVRKAILFEGVCFPVDMKWLALATQAKRLGFPDYTQFEVACILQKIQNDTKQNINYGFLAAPTEVSEGGDQWKKYKRGIDWVREQIVAAGGDPWNFAATDIEIKRAVDKGLYNADENALSLYDDFRTWIPKNASVHDVEDMMTCVRIEEKEAALLGKGLLPDFNAGVAVAIVIVMIGVAVAWVIFNSGGGVSLPNIGGAIKTPLPTTTLINL